MTLPTSPAIIAIYRNALQRLSDAREKVAKESPAASRADVGGWGWIVGEMERVYGLGPKAGMS